MSKKEIERLGIVEKIIERRMKRVEGARLLKVSPKQMGRIVKKYQAEGASGLVSKKRGRSSNRGYSASFKKEVMLLIKSHYSDFGPTFASEKLRERHDILVSDESIRQWMIEAGLWIAKKQARLVVHQQRTRRARFGELVQIDGSPHDWFEGRGPICCLIVFIDDATSRLLQLRFELSETTTGYFHCVRDYVKRYGNPVSFYSDKDSIFLINEPNLVKEAETQFGRAMKTLGIEVICANSPQAKGRVERANKTLQDRLIKEMRLRGISNIETANAYLSEFMVDYNKRFSVEPFCSEDAHRKCHLSDEMLSDILSHQYERTLSKNLELSYHNVIYQVKTKGQGYTLRRAKVTVIRHLDGQIVLRYKGQALEYCTYEKQKKTTPIVCEKQLNEKIDDLIKLDGRTIGYKPKPKHPWRRYAQINTSVAL